MQDKLKQVHHVSYFVSLSDRTYDQHVSPSEYDEISELRVQIHYKPAKNYSGKLSFVV